MIGWALQNRKTKRLFEDFAHQHDLVYFGNVEVEESDDPILGISFARKRNDEHYIHGNINEYDVSLVQRRTTLRAPKHNEGDYDWTVLRIHLKESGLPHIFIDAHHHDDLLYQNIFAKFGRLRLMNNVITPINQSFAEFFYVFAPSEMNATIEKYLPDHIMQRMLERFTQIDVEIADSDLFLYRNGWPSYQKQLDEMLDEGLWLAEHIERAHRYGLEQSPDIQ